MEKRHRRAVITGVGIVSPIGIGKKEFISSLKNGFVGIDTISLFDPTGLPSTIGAEVKDFRPQDFINHNEIKKLGRAAHLGIAAAQLALSDSKLSLKNEEKLNCPVFIGTAVGGMDFAEESFLKIFNNGPSRISPYAGVAVFCASVSSAVSTHLLLHGRSVSISDGCCSATDAISFAMNHIRFGLGDIAICGGADACVTKGVLAAFCKMGVVTKKNDTPKKACLPFHKDRDGFALGEGSWILIVESYEHALDRNAHIYAELSGYGSSCDAFHPSRPHHLGTYNMKAIQMALDDAQIQAKEIDYISAYGNGTVINDSLETLIYKNIFKENAQSIPLSSIKSMIGHPIGATGAAQVLSSALCIDEGFIPPTMNLDFPASDCDLDYVPNKSRLQKINKVLVNTLSFGGKNSCIILNKV